MSHSYQLPPVFRSLIPLSWLRHRAAKASRPKASIGASCESCKFWEVNRYGGVRGPGCDGSASNCRRYAPQHIIQDGRVSANVQWVTTGKNDWCGEYEPR